MSYQEKSNRWPISLFACKLWSLQPKILINILYTVFGNTVGLWIINAWTLQYYVLLYCDIFIMLFWMQNIEIGILCIKKKKTTVSWLYCPVKKMLWTDCLTAAPIPKSTKHILMLLIYILLHAITFVTCLRFVTHLRSKTLSTNFNYSVNPMYAASFLSRLWSRKNNWYFSIWKGRYYLVKRFMQVKTYGNYPPDM